MEINSSYKAPIEFNPERFSMETGGPLHHTRSRFAPPASIGLQLSWPADLRELEPGYSLAPRNRKAFEITETEERLMAAAAIIGDSNRPKAGYSTPAAIGTPTAL